MATAQQDKSLKGKDWIRESYIEQQTGVWPKDGKHILAQYDDEDIIVYQAYSRGIGSYAIEHQKFGGPLFSYSRMSWIKTNFLWMMYRSGWGSKENQEMVLAVRISRNGFDTILSHALTGHDEKLLGKGQSPVRLQWDPDHHPDGSALSRRAIQLGLRNDILARYGDEWITDITDISDFVHDQYQANVISRQWDKLLVPRERVYHVTNEEIAKQIKLID